MSIQGAGGSKGGVGRFFLGLCMFVIGAYLMLSAIQVTNSFYFSHGLFSVGGFQVTSGIIFIPFMIGVGIVFFNSSSIIGWLLAAGSIIIMIIGVISSTHLTLRPMSAFELILITGLLAGGLGLFFSSLRNYSK